MQINIDKFYKNKTILITGGAGYLGSSLSNKFSNIDCNLRVLGSSSKSWMPRNSIAKISLYQGDVSDYNFWFQILNNVDYIFHLASLDGVQDYKREIEVNSLSMLHLLNAINVKKLSPKIIFSSSANIFGNVSNVPVNETFTDNPQSIWSINKLSAEKYLELYYRQYNVDSVTLRLPNIYGAPANMTVSNRVVINNVIYNALNDNAIFLYKNQNCLRDYIFIDDAVNALLSAGTLKSTESKGMFYVIGSEERKTISQAWHYIAKKTEEKLGKKIELKKDFNHSLSVMEMRDFVADSSAFRSATGWKSKVNFQQGIELTVNHIWKNLKRKNKKYD